MISHEIAHMWFGDLVTMRWWNGLWLNEAFATFMELLCVDAFRPDWERWTTFGLSRAAAQRTDGLPSTRPIEFPVEQPEEAGLRQRPEPATAPAPSAVVMPRAGRASQVWRPAAAGPGAVRVRVAHAPDDAAPMSWNGPLVVATASQKSVSG